MKFDKATQFYPLGPSDPSNRSEILKMQDGRGRHFEKNHHISSNISRLLV